MTNYADPMVAGDSYPKQKKLEITHIEIRRVQNGFVLAGINMDVLVRSALGDGPQRVTYVAKDIDELSRVLAWFIDGKDLDWLPTINLPIFDLTHRPGLNPDQVQEIAKLAVREALMVPAVAPTVMPEVGGPLRRG